MTLKKKLQHVKKKNQPIREIKTFKATKKMHLQINKFILNNRKPMFTLGSNKVSGSVSFPMHHMHLTKSPNSSISSKVRFSKFYANLVI